MNDYEKIIAILVNRLGGDVTISVAELEHADFVMDVRKRETLLGYRIRVRPNTLKGELVETAPLALEG